MIIIGIELEKTNRKEYYYIVYEFNIKAWTAPSFCIGFIF